MSKDCRVFCSFTVVDALCVCCVFACVCGVCVCVFDPCRCYINKWILRSSILYERMSASQLHHPLTAQRTQRAFHFFSRETGSDLRRVAPCTRVTLRHISLMFYAGISRRRKRSMRFALPAYTAYSAFCTHTHNKQHHPPRNGHNASQTDITCRWGHPLGMRSR